MSKLHSNSGARKAILARVRSSLDSDNQLIHEPQSLLPTGPTPGAPSEACEKAETSREFQSQLTVSGGKLHVVASIAAARNRFRELASELGLRTVIRSDAAELKCFADDAPHISWLEPVDAPVASDARTALFDVDAGFSTAQFAVAETGTIALDSTCERHRLVSLVPPIHIVLLDEASILPRLGDALARWNGSGPPPTLSFITGPSRTADIELTLVVGVHGPRELHVLLLSGNGADAAPDSAE
ncbi:MAG: L-lactate dehydrogenase complex protein LldG [Planctomycetota bacterium]|jgi:L-lactate dehydrogenase complex protein LldG